MKATKRALIIAILAILCIGMVFANGSDEKAKATGNDSGKSTELVTTIKKPITIEFWHYLSSTHGKCMEELTKEFNETVGKEKGITVVQVYQGNSSDTRSKVIGAIKTKNAPAVIQTSEQFLLDYINAGVVVDLTPYIYDENVGMDDWDDVIEAYRTQASSYGVPGIYDVPFCKSTEVLYYNKDLFEANNIEVPTTWKELEEVSAKLTAITGAPSLGYDNTYNLFITLCKQFGGDFTNEKGDLLFAESDAALKGLTMFNDNVKKGLWRLAGEDLFFSGPFASGKVPMYIGHTTESGYIKMKDPHFTWSAAPIPQQDPNNKCVVATGNMLAALNSKGDPEVSYAAYEYLKFMISKQADLAMTLASGYIPVRYSTFENPEFKAYVESGADDGKIAGPSQSDFFYCAPSFIRDTYSSATLYTEIKNMMSNVLEGGQDPKAAIQEMIGRLK